jgi:Flp pilus assembly protein TadB
VFFEIMVGAAVVAGYLSTWWYRVERRNKAMKRYQKMMEEKDE